MRFEHDTYDIDVYSLCESVYYSCNNDEYDYVLECVNDWIMNGYNDNILLETIMAVPIIFTKNRGTDFDFNGHLVPNDARKGYVLDHKINRAELFDPDFEFNTDIRPSSKIIHTTINGRNIIGKQIYIPSFIKSLPPDLAEKMKQVVGDGRERIGTYATDREQYEKGEPGRALRMFIGWDYKDNGKGEVPKMMSDEAIVRIYTHHMNPDYINSGFYYEPKKLPYMSISSEKAPVKRVDLNHADYRYGKLIPDSPPPPKPQPPKEPPRVVTPQSRLSRFTNYMKNNKGKTALGVGLGAAAIGGGIYAYKQYKNKPRSVIAKRIAALRGVYHKFMINAQRNPNKANVFKRIAAKILSVIDKLMAFMQNTADGR